MRGNNHLSWQLAQSHNIAENSNQFNPQHYTNTHASYEQHTYAFIESNRGHLEISEQSLIEHRLHLQQFLTYQTIKNDKTLAIAKFGREILLIKTLLNLQSHPISSDEQWLQINEDIAILNMIAHMKTPGFVQPVILESLAIVAWNSEEYWLIGAIARLPFNLYQNNHLKRAREIARTFNDKRIFNDLCCILKPFKSQHPFDINEFIESRKLELKQILNDEKFDTYHKMIKLLRISADILLIIAHISIKRVESIPTRESYTLSILIHDLKLLQNQPLENQITAEDLDCLFKGAMHLSELWVVELLLQYNLIIINDENLHKMLYNYRNLPLTAEVISNPTTTQAISEQNQCHKAPAVNPLAHDEPNPENFLSPNKSIEEPVGDHKITIADNLPTAEINNISLADNQTPNASEKISTAESPINKIQNKDHKVVQDLEPIAHKQLELNPSIDVTTHVQNDALISPASEKPLPSVEERINIARAEGLAAANSKSVDLVDKNKRKELARTQREQKRKSKQLAEQQQKQAQQAKIEKERQKKLAELKTVEAKQSEIETKALENKPKELIESPTSLPIQVILEKSKIEEQAIEPVEKIKVNHKIDRKARQKAARKLKQQAKLLESPQEEPIVDTKPTTLSLEEIINNAIEVSDYKSIELTLANNTAANPSILLDKLFSAKAKKNIRFNPEFIEQIPISIRTCYILICSEEVSRKTKISLLKKILDINSQSFFPLNKIFSISERVRSLFPQNSIQNKEIQALKRALVQKEVSCAYLTTDIDDEALHHFMRHTPNDFQVLKILLSEYQRAVIGVSHVAKAILPLHLTNKKKQTFLHVLMEHQSLETIIETLKYLYANNNLVISSLLFFKDENNRTPINILEDREIYSKEAITLLEDISREFIIHISSSWLIFSKEQIATLDDLLYNNKAANNIFNKLALNKDFYKIETIIKRRNCFRESILNECSLACNINNTDTSPKTLHIITMYLQKREMVKSIISHNEYNSVQACNNFLINFILESAETIEDHKLNEIIGSNEFLEAYATQPLTKSYIWFDIFRHIKNENSPHHEDYSYMYERFAAYIKLSNIDSNSTDNENLNLLDKFLLIGGSRKTIASNMQCLALCCEKLCIKVDSRHLYNQANGSYKNEKYSYETLKYLLNKFGNREEVFKIGVEDHRNLLLYATIGAQSPSMIKCLVEYGFDPSKTFHSMEANLILILINSYRVGSIKEDKIIPLLNTYLDDNLINPEVQKEMINYVDLNKASAIIGLTTIPEKLNGTTHKILDLLLAKGVDLFKTFEKTALLNYDLSRLIVAVQNSEVSLRILKIMEEQKPGFINGLLHQQDKSGTKYLDKLSKIPLLSPNGKAIVDYMISCLQAESTAKKLYRM